MSPARRATHPNSWKRIVIDGATIVGSILLAFAIDAWWDERQQRIEEMEILRGLRGEFSRYREELTEGIEYHANARRMVAELIAATRTNSWTSTTLEIDRALATLGDTKTHDFGGGILDAVINGGRLEIISDYELRNKLASWRQVFNEIRDDEIRNMALAENRVVSYMLRWHIPQSRGLELCCSWSKWPQSTRSIEDDPGAVSRLLADPEFEVLLELKHIEVAHTALEYDTGLQAINEILEAIDASLAE